MSRFHRNRNGAEPEYESRIHATREKHSPEEGWTWQVRKVTQTANGPSVTNFPAGRAHSYPAAKQAVKEFVEHQREADSQPWTAE